jgi:hypothetical protein
MKPIAAHKVTIYLGGENQWSGSFIGRPTCEDVVKAIQYVIGLAGENLGKKCADMDYYVVYLREALKVAENAPSYFADVGQTCRIQVGASLIGTIKTRSCTVFDTTGDSDE